MENEKYTFKSVEKLPLKLILIIGSIHLVHMCKAFFPIILYMNVKH
jgi:hypothetical protein